MTEHARLGASNSDRWIGCPGSVRLEEGLPNSQTSYAAEGTAAHELARRCRETGKPASAFEDTVIDVPVDGDESLSFHVGEEMIAAVQAFLDAGNGLRAKYGAACISLYEYQFTLKDLNPPEDMFGTADEVVYARNIRRLHVHDLKYGQGIIVEAVGNTQLLDYALGALLKFQAEYGLPIDDVELTIVQPRIDHPEGVTRSWVVTYEDVVAFAVELMEHARNTQKIDAPRVTGPWCRFCRAAAICPEKREAAQSVAMVAFDAMPIDAPPDPATLPVTQLAHIVTHAHQLEEYLKSVRELAFTILKGGGAIPGLKLVARRANRKWKDEAAVVAWAEKYGVLSKELHKVVIKSPAQIEKLPALKKVTVPEDLYSQESSGPTLALDADPRPALLLGAQHAFAELPRSDNA